MRKLNFSFVASFMLLAGATGGLVAALFYTLSNVTSISLTDALLTILLAPIAQALVVFIYGLLGYPVYSYLVKRNRFKFPQPFDDETPTQ